ncbi:MAG: hypothetical protein ACI90V_012759, partial [Bacillariaceae sp.]
FLFLFPPTYFIEPKTFSSITTHMYSTKWVLQWLGGTTNHGI